MVLRGTIIHFKDMRGKKRLNLNEKRKEKERNMKERRMGKSYVRK
jgi:hypothetical protein